MGQCNGNRPIFPNVWSTIGPPHTHTRHHYPPLDLSSSQPPPPPDPLTPSAAVFRTKLMSSTTDVWLRYGASGDGRQRVIRAGRCLEEGRPNEGLPIFGGFAVCLGRPLSWGLGSRLRPVVQRLCGQRAGGAVRRAAAAVHGRVCALSPLAATQVGCPGFFF